MVDWRIFHTYYFIVFCQVWSSPDSPQYQERRMKTDNKTRTCKDGQAPKQTRNCKHKTGRCLADWILHIVSSHHKRHDIKRQHLLPVLLATTILLLITWLSLLYRVVYYLHYLSFVLSVWVFLNFSCRKLCQRSCCLCLYIASCMFVNFLNVYNLCTNFTLQSAWEQCLINMITFCCKSFAAKREISLWMFLLLKVNLNTDCNIFQISSEKDA